jgi:hypothetical protein
MKVLNEGDKQLRIEVEISSRSSERDFLDQFLADDERRPSQALMRRMVEAQGGSVGIRCPPAGTACVFALLPRRMPKPALAGSA